MIEETRPMEAVRDAATRRGTPPTPASAFWPVLLLALALVGWFAFQSYQLMRERQQLAALRAGQEAQLEAAGKVRASLDTVASATARLADAGNLNARLLVDELRKRGITINPGSPAQK